MATLRLRVGVWLLRAAVCVLDRTDRYYIIPRSRLPKWLDEYIEYLEAIDYRGRG